MEITDVLFARHLNGGGGDVTVVPLSVSANGTYSEEGKAYSPVTVEVSPPENSYQLKSITTPTSLATFEASEMPMPTLKASIVAKQAGSGTPSPENVRPISGWSEAKVSDVGKNLFDIREFINNSTNKQRCTVSVADDDTVTVTATQTGSVWIGFIANIGGTLPTNTFTIPANVGDKFVPSGTSVIIYETDENDIILSSTTRDVGRYYTVTNSNCKKLAFRLDMGSMQQGESVTFKEQIEKGETATEYVPYVEPNLYTISLGQTVYGGEVDVVNGSSGNKITYDVVDMGSLTWYYSSGQRRFSTPSLADVIKPSSGRSAEGLLCSCFECTIDGTDSFLFQSGTSIYVYASEYTDASTFTAAVTGQTLRYELATPTTFTTQPTPVTSLEGINNLSVDCGDVIEGEYFKAL